MSLSREARTFYMYLPDFRADGTRLIGPTTTDLEVREGRQRYLRSRVSTKSNARQDTDMAPAWGAP